ncbi:MAG TPA: SRPBCC family protein [Pyrinomonadaceae bacterium]|nr:SRPBCC family protein [Pyrinomonadaceae bacterium]
MKSAKIRSLCFYAELYVEQSPATVWSYFSDLTRWSCWSPICLDCCLVNGAGLGPGATMRIRFQVARLPTVVLANVIGMNSPQFITWTGVKFGVSSIHTYRFESQGTGTLMINDERFFGVPYPISNAMEWWYRKTDLSLKSLQGIKRELGHRRS